MISARDENFNHIVLSELARDPAVAAFFRRGEDRNGQQAVTEPKQPVLIGGSSREMVE